MIQRGSDTSFTNLWSLLLYIQSLLHSVIMTMMALWLVVLKLIIAVSPRNENMNWLVGIKFLNLFLYSSNQKLKNLLVRTKFYWSWAGGPVHIVRTEHCILTTEFLLIVVMYTIAEWCVFIAIIYIYRYFVTMVHPHTKTKMNVNQFHSLHLKKQK